MSMLTAVTFTSFTSCSNDDDIAVTPVSPAPTRQHVADLSQRVINFEGVDNARDMGGLVMQDGRTVCFDKLVRSGKLAKATDADVAILQNQYHLSDVFDFRFDLEFSMVGVSTANFEAALDLIDQQYGSMEQYLENQLGFSKEEQMQLRAKYLTQAK